MFSAPTKLMPVLAMTSALVATAGSALAQGVNFWVPISMTPVANDRMQNRNFFYPAGSQLLGGVPFFIDPIVNSTWNANLATSGPNPNGNPRVVELVVNLQGAREVHTLINTDWGQGGPASFARVEFVGSGGLLHGVDLVGNVDIRDWNQFAWTNTINGTSTTEVWTAGSVRLDKQRFILPVAFHTAELRRIRFIDTGAAEFQRILVSGASVLVPRPRARVWSSAFGGNDKRYLAVQALAGITWADANAAAIALGGTLADITSAAENAFVFSLIGGNQAYWQADSNNNNVQWGPWIGGQQAIGASEPDGNWSWTSGAPWAYTNWAQIEPNNFGPNGEDRLGFIAYNVPAASTWNDFAGASLLRGYIVELPACLADVAGPNQSIGADGELTADDIIVFLSWYFGADPRANIAGPNQSPIPDNTFTADDIIVFLSRYFGGC